MQRCQQDPKLNKALPQNYSINFYGFPKSDWPKVQAAFDHDAKNSFGLQQLANVKGGVFFNLLSKEFEKDTSATGEVWKSVKFTATAADVNATPLLGANGYGIVRVEKW